MKKLLLFAFIFSTFSIYANHEDLKQAIIKSNITQVKEILKTTKLSKEEIISLSNMAQNIIPGRLIDKKIAIIPEIILGLPGTIITLKGFIGVTGFGAFAVITKFKDKELYKDITNDKWKILGALSLVQTIGLSLLYGSYKIFKITRKWHYDAVEIKQIIESQNPEIIKS